ncbi:Conservative hypothetical protein probably involved in hydantoin, pyrimidine utilization [Leifsonia rubra CMS 76R]|nr:Conservative hypothetical protein probably involved in hydantoin, pyrimidine utilization [Leifsonia rubra CMS 76R]
MRELTSEDARFAVLGGGVLACGGGGWQHHGELMGAMATSMGRPRLAQLDDLPSDSWIATVTAIGAPASTTWEIQPVDYVHALTALIDAVDVPITGVMTAQNGYSTTLNGWIQSSVLGVAVLDAAGDVRAHPTGKLGSMGLTTRADYVSTQVVSGGNRELHGHFLSINHGTIATCDDVLRDISVRVGGFIASARSAVELQWVRDNAAIGAISLALNLGRAMSDAAAAHVDPGEAVLQSVVEALGARIVDSGRLRFVTDIETRGGWDRGVFGVGEHTVAFLNEFMTVDSAGERIATYPDTIIILDAKTGQGLAVKDAVDGLEVVLAVVDAADLPVSTSAIDPIGLAECEEIMGMEFLRYLNPKLKGGETK